MRCILLVCKYLYISAGSSLFLQALSERFNGEIADELVAHSCFFPDEYFTCSILCLSCGSVLSYLFCTFTHSFSFMRCHLCWYLLLIRSIRCVVSNPRCCCKNSMNHVGEGVCHEAKYRCRYSVQYDNRIYTCKVSVGAHLCSLLSLSLPWFTAVKVKIVYPITVGLLWRG